MIQEQNQIREQIQHFFKEANVLLEYTYDDKSKLQVEHIE
jgi:hypothetical protein